MIPKKIHYCWFGGSPLPELVYRCIESWRKHCPDYEIILWNEANSDLENPVVKRALKDGLYAFAADYVRLKALYNYGGIYLDTDIELIKSLDSLLHHDAFSAFQSSESVANGVIASIKGNCILSECMNVMENQVEQGVPFCTGPRILTRVLNLRKGSKIVIHDTISGLYLLPIKSFYPYNPYDESQKVKQLMFSDITSDTFGIHHWQKSWGKSGVKALALKVKNRLRKYGFPI